MNVGKSNTCWCCDETQQPRQALEEAAPGSSAQAAFVTLTFSQTNDPRRSEGRSVYRCGTLKELGEALGGRLSHTSLEAQLSPSDGPCFSIAELRAKAARAHSANGGAVRESVGLGRKVKTRLGFGRRRNASALPCSQAKRRRVGGKGLRRAGEVQA